MAAWQRAKLPRSKSLRRTTGAPRTPTKSISGGFALAKGRSGSRTSTHGIPSFPTGTPIENRIDELHSLMDFLNPAVLGPLFRFNREFYELDERGRPGGYRNLDQLHERIAPYMLRRRKAEVETELPDRTDRNHFVPLR